MTAVFSFDDEDHDSFVSPKKVGRGLSVSSNDEHYVPSFADTSRSESLRSSPKSTAASTPFVFSRKPIHNADEDALDLDRIHLNTAEEEREYEVEFPEEFASEEAPDMSRLTMRHQADDFQPLKVLGKGGYGKVRKFGATRNTPD